nr:lysine-specific demethylase 8 [Quercus suber]
MAEGEEKPEPSSGESERNSKRKISANDVGHTTQSWNMPGLESLIKTVEAGLSTAVAHETIHLCGKAPLEIIAARPDDVLQLAYQQINAVPYMDVEKRWRRLHEEASLRQVVSILRSQTSTHDQVRCSKRARVMDETVPTKCGADSWLNDVIAILDRSIMISGCPGRRTLFDAIFQHLGSMIPDDEDHRDEIPSDYSISYIPEQHLSLHQILRYDTAIGLEAFHIQLKKAEPCIIPEAIDHWPALEAWNDPRYLLKVTLGGRRLVPVEIGSSYTEEGWAQRVITMRDFLNTYVLTDSPPAIGYLAQHDLFEQLPELKNDIITPDYCYTSPPAADDYARKTAGLSSVQQLDEPLRNVWFGPKGTKTPLHTDPYHNILCQVVGYKYVRLYAPSETPNLYPRGVDENGISMENTSEIDVSIVRSDPLGTMSENDARIEQNEKFPLFAQAQYVEAILSPGDSLYIPVGWWHYVESLTTSFSVSFWWN